MTISDFIDDLALSKRRTLSIGRVKLPWPFPVAYGLHSSSAMVFGIPVFGGANTGVVRLVHRLFRSVFRVRRHQRHGYQRHAHGDVFQPLRSL